MKLYHSGLVRVASNTRYPFKVDVQNVEQLLNAVKYDHVAALYRDSKRSSDNFLSSDCIMMDVDNAPGKGQPDIPSSEWVDLDRIRRDLPSVAFYAVTSRNYMIEKDGRPARPKYHLYFQIPETANAEDYKRIKDELQARLPYFDQNAKDAARFFYGNEQAQAWFYKGSQLITEWIAKTPAPEQKKPEKIQPISRPTQTQLTSAQDNESRLRSALDAIPCSNVTRDEWVKIGMAIHSQGWADGLQTWDAWSSTDPARYKSGECARKWRGFKAGLIDHTYIIHMAQEYGWTAPRKTQQQAMKGETAMPAALVLEQKKPETTSPIMSMLDRFKGDTYKPIATGIKEIDNILGGGFFVKQLITLGAHPGAGKTLFCQQILETMARTQRAEVLFFNLEMDSDQLFARSLSRATGYSVLKIMQGFNWDLETEAKVTEAARDYEEKASPFIHYNPQLKKEELTERERNRAHFQTIYDTMVQFEQERVHKELPLVCCVDYLQILQGDRGADDVTIIKNALQLFKDFARKYKAVVILVMAHSRATNISGKVTQGAGRDSSAIEYSGDVQLSLNYTAIVKRAYESVDSFEKALESGNAKGYTKQDITLALTKGRFVKPDSRVYMKLDGEKSCFGIGDESKFETGDKPASIKPRRVW